MEAASGPVRLGDPKVVLIAAFVATLFVDLPFGPRSLQEALLAGALLFFVLASRQVAVRVLAAVLPLAVGAASWLSAVIGLGLDPSTATLAVRMVAIGAVAALVVPVLAARRYRWTFAWALVIGAVVAAGVSILQSADVLPLFGPARAETRGVFGADVTRATGFQFDPNFHALTMSLGAAPLLFLSMRWYIRVGALGIVALGVGATFSRMGVLLLPVVLVCWLVLTPRVPFERYRRAAVLALTAVILVTGGALFRVSLGGEQGTAATSRLEETRSGFERFRAIGAEGLESAKDRSSTENRIVLAAGALDAIREDWTIGTAPGYIVLRVWQETGIAQYPHNSYLDLLLAIGVPLGGAVLVALAWAFRFTLRAARSRGDPVAASLTTVSVVVAFGLLFLSQALAVMLFLPWILGLALRSSTAGDAAGGLESTGARQPSAAGVPA